jgi:hypothetical protein
MRMSSVMLWNSTIPVLPPGEQVQILQHLR